MYLMDCITQLAGQIRATGRRDQVMQGYVDLASKLVGTPRYLLDPYACRTCVELNLGRPKVLFEAMQHVTIPYPRLWVEWDDHDRQELRHKFHEPLSYAELRPIPGRVGFLLEAQPGGRSGTATWSWTTPGEQPDTPNIGAVQPYFDLDRAFPLPSEQVEGLLKGNLAHLWRDNPTQLEALFDIWRTAEHRSSPWGELYFRALHGIDPGLARALAYGDVVGEYIVIWSFLLMLTSARKTIDLRPVDRSKLNKARAQRREIALLDHTQVVMHIDPQLRSRQIRQPLSYQRKSPRVHLVSSYLNRRGNKHWIVQPFMRGSGDTIHRVTKVRS